MTQVLPGDMIMVYNDGWLRYHYVETVKLVKTSRMYNESYYVHTEVGNILQSKIVAYKRDKGWVCLQPEHSSLFA